LGWLYGWLKNSFEVKESVLFVNKKYKNNVVVLMLKIKLVFKCIQYANKAFFYSAYLFFSNKPVPPFVHSLTIIFIAFQSVSNFIQF